MLLQIKDIDCGKRLQFVKDILHKGDEFLKSLFFSDESTFHLCGKISTHKFLIVYIWGTEKTDSSIEQERNSPKVNVK